MISIDIRKALHSAEGPLQLQVRETIPAGELVAVYGKSGAGKTTLLRILAGLMEPEEGMITVADAIWFDAAKKRSLPPQKRGVGFVFQDYALFPNMTVRENIAFASRGKGDRDIVEELIGLIGLHALAERKPGKLSGGQQQRVALARSLARRPTLLLLDEPFAALDLEMRLALQDELLALHKRFNLTTILVSHDIAEVVKIADRVLHLDRGAVLRSGTPHDLFVDQRVSGKFKFLGEILSLQPGGVVTIVSVQIGNNVVKVVATADEAAAFRTGDRVMVSSKAFNPIIVKV